MYEIVAAKIGDIITTNFIDIRQAFMDQCKDIELLDRRRMQFMAACDLGPQWERIASSPTLFIINDDESLEFHE
jgi:hypothetical protein